MIKSILYILIFFFALFYLSLNVHQSYIENNNLVLPYSLQKVYLFHLTFSLLICIHFKLFSTVDKISQQLGFIYLVTLVLKIILFSVIFYQPIFNEESLSKEASISLIIPMVIFLLTEVFYVIKIINKTHQK